MRILGFILLFLFGLFFSTPFKLVESTKQNHAGGRMESGTSTVYTFKLVAKKASDKLQFQDLWIGVKYYPIEATHQNPDNSISTEFEKGDTIYFQAIERYLPNENGELKLQKSPNPKVVPMEYKGHALIGYTFKGKKHYYVVEHFKDLPNVNHP
jgi:hypothetical protein